MEEIVYESIYLLHTFNNSPFTIYVCVHSTKTVVGYPYYNKHLSILTRPSLLSIASCAIPPMLLPVVQIQLAPDGYLHEPSPPLPVTFTCLGVLSKTYLFPLLPVPAFLTLADRYYTPHTSQSQNALMDPYNYRMSQRDGCHPSM